MLNVKYCHCFYIPSGHIVRESKKTVSGYLDRRFNPRLRQYVCVLEQDTLSELLQSTQLTNEYQTETSTFGAFTQSCEL